MLFRKKKKKGEERKKPGSWAHATTVTTAFHINVPAGPDGPVRKKGKKEGEGGEEEGKKRRKPVGGSGRRRRPNVHFGHATCFPKEKKKRKKEGGERGKGENESEAPSPPPNFSPFFTGRKKEGGGKKGEKDRGLSTGRNFSHHTVVVALFAPSS